MFNVGRYFEKFSRIEEKSRFEKETVTKVIKDICGIENIPFEIKKDVLYIKGSPIMRSIVYTKKVLILETLRTAGLKNILTDIR